MKGTDGDQGPKGDPGPPGPQGPGGGEQDLVVICGINWRHPDPAAPGAPQPTSINGRAQLLLAFTDNVVAGDIHPHSFMVLKCTGNDDLVDCWLVRQDGDRGRTHGDLSSVQDGDRKESGADRARRQSPTAGGATAQFVGAGFQPPNYCVL